MPAQLGVLAVVGIEFWKISGREPLSPQSDAKAKGQHYTVKEFTHGYECLICGLLGDISFIKGSPCKPVPDDLVSMTRKFQEESDAKMAQELHALQVEEEYLEQLLVLQQLEQEETLLVALQAKQSALKVDAISKALQSGKELNFDHVASDEPANLPDPEPAAVSVPCQAAGVVCGWV